MSKRKSEEENNDSKEQTTPKGTNQVSIETDLLLQKDLRNTLKKARENDNCENLKDVTLISKDGKKFPIHSVILSIRSEYFKKLFTSDKQKTEHKMPIKAETLGKILAYIYGDFKECFNIKSDKKILETFQAAKDFLIPKYEDEYCRYLIKMTAKQENYSKEFNTIVLAKKAVLLKNNLLIDEVTNLLKKKENLYNDDTALLCNIGLKNKCTWLLDEVAKVLHDPVNCDNNDEDDSKCLVTKLYYMEDFESDLTEEVLKFVAKICLPLHVGSVLFLFLEFYYPEELAEDEETEERKPRRTPNKFAYPLEDFVDRIPWTELDTNDQIGTNTIDGIFKFDMLKPETRNRIMLARMNAQMSRYSKSKEEWAKAISDADKRNKELEAKIEKEEKRVKELKEKSLREIQTIKENILGKFENKLKESGEDGKQRKINHYFKQI